MYSQFRLLRGTLPVPPLISSRDCLILCLPGVEIKKGFYMLIESHLEPYHQTLREHSGHDGLGYNPLAMVWLGSITDCGHTSVTRHAVEVQVNTFW